MERNPAGEILSITFDHEEAHIALCHKLQGYSANGRPEALLIKSAGVDADLSPEIVTDLEFIKSGNQGEVTITTSMFDFLRKWYDLYWSDADELARMLGYSGDGYDSGEDYVKEQVATITLLKSGLVKTAPQKDIDQLAEFIKASGIQNSFSEGNPEVKNEGEGHQKPSENINNQGALMAQDQEKLEKAQKDLDTLQARLAEFEKAAVEAKQREEAMIAKVAEFEKAQASRVEAAFVAKTEEYSFVTPEEKVSFAKSLVSLNKLNGEIAEVVLAMLDKAQEAVDAVDSVQGSDSAAGVSFEKSSSLEEKLLAKYKDAK